MYAAKYMLVGFNYHNVSFERGVTPKNDRLLGGGGHEKKED